MMLTLFAALMQPDPQVSLQLPAARLTEIVRKIEAQVGERVKTTGPDTRQLVFVRVSSMPFSRLRDSLAFVTGGRWLRDAEGWSLQTQSEEQFETEAYQAALRKWFAQGKKLPGLKEGLTRDDLAVLAVLSRPGFIQSSPQEGQQQLVTRTPKHRLLLRTLWLLNQSDLLALPHGGRAVYALHPTPLQRQIPAQFREHFQEFLTESREAALEDFVPPTIFGSGEESAAAINHAKTEAVHLVLNRDGSGLRAELHLYDGEGARLDQFEAWPVPETAGESRIASELPSLASLIPSEVVAQAPKDEEAVAREIRALSSQKERMPGMRVLLSPGAEAALRNQRVDDLLSRLPSSIMNQFCEVSGRQALVKLNDFALRSAYLRTVEGMPLAKVIQPLVGYSTQEGGSLRIEKDLVCSRPGPIIGRWSLSGQGREAAEQAIKAETSGQHRLEALAGIAAKEGLERNVFWPAFCSGLFTGQATILPNEGQTALLRLYGLLSEGQRHQARNGGVRLQFAQLTPEQQGAYRRLVLDQGQMVSPEFQSSSRPLSDLQKEPTLLFAVHPLSSVSLVIALKKESAPMAFHFGRSLPLDSRALANILYRNELTPQGGLTSSFVVGIQASLALTTRLSEDLSLKHSYSVLQAQPDSPLRSFKDLPSDILREAEDMVRKWRSESGAAPPLRSKPPSS